jgi:crotonobetainyl-CoA:carnitine CoA-transferase CaiB-like acyl-CoA transferase
LTSAIANRSWQDDVAAPPLAGLTVLDLGQIYLGPYAGLLLAKAGANVIKIEPVTGEPARRRSDVRGAGLPFCMLNANKKSLSINLKSERGRELLIGLARQADVLLENFLPGVLDRLGVGWHVLSAANPLLVYASGSGFGLDGPDRDRLAMDLTVQAATGVMSVTGYEDGEPLKSGAAFADFISGVHLFGAIMAALYARERTGRGQLVEVAMQEAVLPTLASNLGMLHSSGGKSAPRTGNRHGGLAVAPYNVYRCADGHVALICQVEGHWNGLIKAMGRPDLAADSRFTTNAARVANMDDTDALVGAWAAVHTRAELNAMAERFRFLVSPIRDLPEVMGDTALHDRGMLETIDHPELGKVVLPGSPLRFHGSARIASEPSERLGASNDAVLGSMLGLGTDALEDLRREGVI